MPGRHKWRGVCAEENAFAMSCNEMATLAAYDPVYPWSWMKTSLSGRSCRGLTVAQ